jgi:hypothetical protein
MATIYPDLLKQDALDVKLISDVQELLKNKAEGYELLNKFEHEGVLLLEIKKRRSAPTKEYRVIVLRQNPTQHGEVVLMRLSDSWGKATTTHGLDLKSGGGIHHTHWCSGLAVQRVPAKKEKYSIAKRFIHDFREGFCKKLLDMIRNDEDWGKQKWEDVKVNLDHCCPA